MNPPATLLRRDLRRSAPQRRVTVTSARLRVALTLSVGALLLAAAGCVGDSVPHTDLDGDLAAVRAAFNQDVDKVRAVLLGSPT